MTELKESLVSNRQPLVSLLLLLLMMFIGWFAIGQLAGLEVGSLLYEGDLLSELQKSKPDALIFYPVMVAQGVGGLVGLIIIPVLYLRFVEHKSLSPFFRRESEPLKVFAIIPLVGICFLIAISPITEWNMNFQFPDSLQEIGDWARAQEDKYAELTKLLTNFDTPGAFILGLTVIALLPGIGEELVFRGLIQNEFWRGSKNIHASIWLTAILFSAIHMQFFGFVPRMLLGALFGYLYYWSGNLLVPMIAHIFHNGFTLTMIYLYNTGVVNNNIDLEESAPLSLVGLCAVFTFTLLYFFRKHYTQEQQS